MLGCSFDAGWQIGFQLLVFLLVKNLFSVIFSLSLSPILFNSVHFNVRKEKLEKIEMIRIVINLNAKMVFIFQKEQKWKKKTQFFPLHFALACFRWSTWLLLYRRSVMCYLLFSLDWFNVLWIVKWFVHCCCSTWQSLSNTISSDLFRAISWFHFGISVCSCLNNVMNLLSVEDCSLWVNWIAKMMMKRLIPRLNGFYRIERAS